MILSIVMFIGYLVFAVWSSGDNEQQVERARKKAIEARLLSLSGAFLADLENLNEVCSVWRDAQQ